MHTQKLLVATLLLTVLIPASSTADPSHMAVGSNGTVLKLHSGTYGDLFPEGLSVNPEYSVLSLDVLSTGGSERLLVPGTENLDTDVVSALYFCKESGLTYLLWEGLVNGIHPFLNLVSFDGEQWSEIIPIARSVFADKGTADLVIVPESDAKLKTAADAVMPSERTVIYVAWQEIAPFGSDNFLVPLILEDGEYIEGSDIFNLSHFLGSEESKTQNISTRASVDPNLLDVLSIQPSAKGSAVVVGFINRETGKFLTLEFEMLPLALSALAERVQGLIIQYAEVSSNLEELIAHVQGAIEAENPDFHPSLLQYVAKQIGEMLAELPTVSRAVAPDVLEKAGIFMIDVGARVRRKGMVDLEPIGIFTLGQLPGDLSGPRHYMKVSLVVERDAPAVEGPASLFLSRTGDHALTAWASEAAVFYRETQGESWGEIQRVELRDGLDGQTVYRILSERTLNR